MPWILLVFFSELNDLDLLELVNVFGHVGRIGKFFDLFLFFSSPLIMRFGVLNPVLEKW